MTVWNYIVMGLSAGLLIFLLILESGRSARARLAMRVIASVSAVAALTCLVMPTACRRMPLAVTGKRDTGHALPLGSGITAVHWDRQVQAGEQWRMQGAFMNETGRPVSLELWGAGGLLDSTVVQKGAFELSVRPAQRGRALYRLIALSGIDTLEKEEVPVEVLPGKTLRILMLTGSPGFETRWLADWLSENGHAVAMRTTISRDKYSKVYLNMQPVALDRLSVELLNRFDIVVTEGVASGEQSLLRRQVAERGLGWVIRDSMVPGAGRQVLKRDSVQRPLVCRSIYGRGKIVFTKLEPGGWLMLSGQQAKYAEGWTTVLQGAVREGEEKEVWQFSPALPQVNAPVEVFLRTGKKDLPQGILGGSGVGVTVYMDQHPLLPFYWEGAYWPAEGGWHSACTPQGDTTWWYVWNESSWKRWRAQEEHKPGRDTLDSLRGVDNEGEKRGAAQGSMGRGWFYLVFFLCIIFLWVERKL